MPPRRSRSSNTPMNTSGSKLPGKVVSEEEITDHFWSRRVPLAPSIVRSKAYDPLRIVFLGKNTGNSSRLISTLTSCRSWVSPILLLLAFQESPILLSSFSLFCCLNTTLTTKTSTTGEHLSGGENPAKAHIFTYKLPPKPQHGRMKLSPNPPQPHPPPPHNPYPHPPHTPPCPPTPTPTLPQPPTPLSPNPQHRYPPTPNMLKWSYPLNPNIRSAAKREILMGLSRNFLRETRQAAQRLSPKPQHAWAELSPKPQHRYPLTPTTGRFLQKKGGFLPSLPSRCPVVVHPPSTRGPHTCVRGYS